MKNSQPSAENKFDNADKILGKSAIHINTKPNRSKIRYLFCPQGLSLFICRPLNGK